MANQPRGGRNGVWTNARRTSNPRTTPPVPTAPTDPWQWLTEGGHATESDDRGPGQRLDYVFRTNPTKPETLLLTPTYRDNGNPLRAMPVQITDEEREAVARIMALPRAGDGMSFSLQGRNAPLAIKALKGLELLTERRRPLVIGDPMTGLDRWDIDDDGVQTFRLVEGDQTRLVDMDGPWLLDGSTLSPVGTTLPPHIALRLALSGPLSPETSLQVRTQLSQIAPDAAPRAIRIRRRPSDPMATVTLDRDGDTPVARIGASYDGIAVQDMGRGGEARSYDPETGTLDVVTRDAEAERRILKDASMLGLEETADPAVRRYAGQNPVVDAALHDEANRTRMEDAGWTVSESPRWNIRVQRIDRLDLKVALGLDQPGSFILDVVGDGQIVDFIDPLAAIARAIPEEADDAEAQEHLRRHLRGDDAVVRSDDGRIWIMAAAEFLSLATSLRRILTAPRGPTEPLRADLYSISDLAGLSRDIGLGAPDSLKRLLVAMRGENARTIEWPMCFSGDRDQKQLHAASWMRTLFEAGYGGILADDVGYGKTVEIGLHVASMWEEGLLLDGALIAVPNIAMKGWARKMATLFPGLPIVLWHGRSRPETNRGDIVLTSHDLVKRTSCPLNARAWTLAVLDEAQDAKKATSHLAVAFAGLDAQQKIPATAYPIENSLDDLWTLMNIANEGLLGTLPEYRKVISGPISREADVVAVNRINAITAPFQLMRIDPDRPMPTIEDVVVSLTPSQKELYDLQIGLTRTKHQKKLDRARESGVGTQALGMSIFLSLTRVRQLCCSPLLMPGGVSGPVSPYSVSPKTAAMVDMARDFVARGERGIVFSSWTGHLDIVAIALNAAGIRTVQYDGRMSTKDRGAAEDAFIAGEADVLLMTTKCGGRSLDFNEADFVFFADPWWNPKVERQAIGRTTRRGQTKTIRVYRFLTASPVEERIMHIHHVKDRLSELVTPGRIVEAVEGITLDDIDALLRTFTEYDDDLRMAA
jgi:hypothetical protein